MRTGVPLTVGVLCVGIGLELGVRWSVSAALAIQRPVPEGVTGEVVTGEADWTALLPALSARRIGTPPSLSHEPSEAGRRGCRRRISADHLAHLSDAALSASGLPTPGPVVVLQDGEPLTARPASEPLSGRCRGVSAFGSGTVLFTPRSARHGSFSLALSPALPLETPAGEAWWVYAGTGISLDVERVGALAGSELTARVWARGVSESVGTAVLSAAGGTTTLRALDGVLVGSLPLTVPGGAWSVSVEVPTDGQHLVVERLTLSDGHRRVDLLSRAR
jgi:hypothetical protein